MTLPIDLQTAVYEALVAADVCSGAVFSRIPQTQPLPFCLIGDDTIEGDREAGEHFRVEVQVTIYAANRKAAKIEYSKVLSALYRDLPIANHKTYEYTLERCNFTIQPDGLTDQCVAVFSFLVIPSAE